MRKIYLILVFLTINMLFLSTLIRMGVGPAFTQPRKEKWSEENLVETLSEEILRRQEELLWKQLGQQPGPPPLSPDSSHQRQFDLQGVFWGTPHPQAIINRQIISVGDEIKGAKTVSIRKEGVTLLQNGQEILLKPDTPK